MRSLRPVLLVLGVAGLALLAFTPTVVAAPPTTAVRVPASAVRDLDRLGMAPAVDLDYGGFRWLELDPAELARLVASGVPYQEVEGAGTVRVMGYAFDPVVEGEPQLPARLQGQSDPGLRLVQLIAPLREEWVADLGSLGVTLLQYYPSNTHLVWVDSGQAARVSSLPFVRWQGGFQPAYRIDPSLRGMSGLIENVAVTFYDDGRVDETLDRITSLGGCYVQHFPAQPDQRFLTALFALDAGAVESAAQVGTVWALEYSPPRPVLLDEMCAQIVSGGYAGDPATPYPGFFTWLAEHGVDGSGVTWAHVDTGLDGSHPDIGGRTATYVTYPGAPPADTDPNGHGSHTAGAIFGDPRPENGGTGIQDPDGFYWGLGVAPRAGMVIQNATVGSPFPPAGGWQLLCKDSVQSGAIGSSNSWGASYQQGYTTAARTHDLMVRDANFDTPTVAEPLVMVFAAGNGGPGPNTIANPQHAKNLITVGASESYRVGAISDLATWSSRGPSQDGRLLPNVIAPGHWTASWIGSSGAICGIAVPGSGSAYYSYCLGTSMACPLVAGASALVADWWGQEGWGVPSPAMVKALLINGAVDMVGGSGVSGNIPNNNQGWGRVDLDNVIRTGVASLYEDQETLLGSTGESQTITVGVPDPSRPLKVTLVWSDAAAAINANPALVNNLDLNVATGGQTYLGNVFASGWSTTGGVADTLNNIESVYLQAAGDEAVITVAATAVNGDGVPYNGDTTDQDFALVCSNCTDQAGFNLDVTPATLGVCAPADGVFDVAVGSFLGFADPVDLDVTGNPAGTTVGFSVDPVAPPGASALTIGSTGAATVGSYPIQVSGASTTGIQSRTVTFDLFSATPGGVTPVSPAVYAVNQELRPTFAWSAATQAGTYDLQVAIDPSFVTIVVDATGIVGASYTPTADLAVATQHYWRVRASNDCGAGAWSTVRRFATRALPGECGPGTAPEVAFLDDFESGVGLWTHSGTGDTWALSGARVHSGASAFYAVDPPTWSDQQLVSPLITLPATGLPLTLQFWNWQQMEINGPAYCYDGAILEISTDGGTTWAYLPTALMLTDPYNGPILAYYIVDGWCSDPAQDWLESVVDVGAFAGRTVRFRFRLGSDAGTGREGWYVDDVTVQSCSSRIFGDWFENGTTSAWSATAP